MEFGRGSSFRVSKNWNTGSISRLYNYGRKWGRGKNMPFAITYTVAGTIKDDRELSSLDRAKKRAEKIAANNPAIDTVTVDQFSEITGFVRKYVFDAEAKEWIDVGS